MSHGICILHLYLANPYHRALNTDLPSFFFTNIPNFYGNQLGLFLQKVSISGLNEVSGGGFIFGP